MVNTMHGSFSTLRATGVGMDKTSKGKPTQTPAAVGDRLRLIRGVSGLSQTDLARRIGHKQNTYSSYENGSRKCSVECAILVCEHFDATLDYVFRGHNEGLAQVRIRELAKAR